MDFFNSRIHHWYAIYKRDLPWRNARNPYFIWLSEIILQQTRIDQGLAYYLRFTEEFPTINDLANASEDQVLKLWQGLGYYSRARNLFFTAKYINQHHHGMFPDDYNSILSLKGIGEYTAAAIASISFNLEYPAVDGNVYRVLSRFFGIQEPIDTNAGKKVFYELAKELIKGTNPGMHNQALMEFGALQCIPKNPDCQHCPLREGCFAFGSGKIGDLPVKQNKTKQRDRYFNYLVFVHNKYTWLRQRTKNDIWKGLFEFPFIETSEKTDVGQILINCEWGMITNSSGIIVESISSWKVHILSHQKIHYRFIKLNMSGEIEMLDDLIRVNKEDILSFAVPKLLEIYIDEFLKK
ncbi:MAG TPA: A/G-specific adenine glycosylase [Prolixibacteraceae bacterium]|nr:A/G-specific adenine glycosylase [Prolixibacteraceae bacterium]